MSTVNDDLVLVRGLDVTARRTDQVAELSPRSAGGVLLETLIGRYVLDRDGREVWLLIDGRRSIREVVERIAETLGMPVEQIRRPIHELCARLLELGLVQVVTAADAAALTQLTVAAA